MNLEPTAASVEGAPCAGAARRAQVATRIGPAAIRAYDIRGHVGRDIDRGGAYALGLAYAGAARAAGVRRVGVARDGRLTSPTLEQALVWGLMDGGMRIERLGLCP